MELSKQAKEALISVGWFKGRKILISRWERSLASEGFSSHQAAQRFLAEYGGLILPSRSFGRSQKFTFNFDPLLAVGEVDRFREASQILGASLFPIGEIVDGHLFLAVTQNGMYYAVMDELFFYAYDCSSCLDRLIRQGRFR